jgi:hypothetical protein
MGGRWDSWSEWAARLAETNPFVAVAGESIVGMAGAWLKEFFLSLGFRLWRRNRK